MATYATQAPSLSHASSAREGGGRATKGANASKQSRREPRRNGGCGGSRVECPAALFLFIEDTMRAVLRVVGAFNSQWRAPSHAHKTGTPNANMNCPARPSAAGSAPSKSKRRRTRRQRARTARQQSAGATGRRAAAEVDSARVARASASLPHSASRGNKGWLHASAATMDFATDCSPVAAVAAAPAAAAAVAGTYREALLTDSGDRDVMEMAAQPTQPLEPLGFALNPSAPSFVGGRPPMLSDYSMAENFQERMARPARS